MYGCLACMSVCAPCMWNALGCQKRSPKIVFTGIYEPPCGLWEPKVLCKNFSPASHLSSPMLGFSPCWKESNGHHKQPCLWRLSSVSRQCKPCSDPCYTSHSLCCLPVVFSAMQGALLVTLFSLALHRCAEVLLSPHGSISWSFIKLVCFGLVRCQGFGVRFSWASHLGGSLPGASCLGTGMVFACGSSLVSTSQ